MARLGRAYPQNLQFARVRGLVPSGPDNAYLTVLVPKPSITAAGTTPPTGHASVAIPKPRVLVSGFEPAAGAVSWLVPKPSVQATAVTWQLAVSSYNPAVHASPNVAAATNAPGVPRPEGEGSN